MHNLKPGELLALGGLILLLVHNLVRRQLLKARQPRGLLRFWLSWGDLVVFLIILAGLTLMWAQK